jgi:hypothetical protein
MVRGCARRDSDLDLNLPAHDWNEQIEWRRIWSDLRHRQAFLAALQPLLDSLSLRVDVAPNNPDQHTYDICLDLETGVMTDPESRFPDSSGRWWDGYQLKWLPRPPMAKNVEVTDDEWASEVELWRDRYGDRFLTR